MNVGFIIFSHFSYQKLFFYYVILNIIFLGSSLPSVFIVKVEKPSPSPSVGYLYLVDLGLPKFTKEEALQSRVPGLSSSIVTFKKIVENINSIGFVGDLPYSDSLITNLCSGNTYSHT